MGIFWLWIPLFLVSSTSVIGRHLSLPDAHSTMVHLSYSFVDMHLEYKGITDRVNGEYWLIKEGILLSSVCSRVTKCDNDSPLISFLTFFHFPVRTLCFVFNNKSSSFHTHALVSLFISFLFPSCRVLLPVHLCRPFPLPTSIIDLDCRDTQKSETSSLTEEIQEERLEWVGRQGWKLI